MFTVSFSPTKNEMLTFLLIPNLFLCLLLEDNFAVYPVSRTTSNCKYFCRYISQSPQSAHWTANMHFIYIAVVHAPVFSCILNRVDNSMYISVFHLWNLISKLIVYIIVKVKQTPDIFPSYCMSSSQLWDTELLNESPYHWFNKKLRILCVCVDSWMCLKYSFLKKMAALLKLSKI